MDILNILYYAFLYILGLLVIFKVLTILFSITVAYVFAKRNPPKPLERKVY